MHEHLSRELFRALAGGWRTPGDLVAIALAHLFELCPRCRQEFEAWRREVREDQAVPENTDYEAVLDRIRAHVEPPADGAVAPIDADLRLARSRAEELLRLAPEQQAEWIRTEADRHAGLLLAEVLIEESRRKAPGYPRQAYTLAHLARVVLHHAPISFRAAELYARALAHMGNALRVIGDLPRADQVLADARYFLRTQGGGHRLARARLDSLEAALRTDQGRFGKAVTLYLRALMTYELEGAAEETAPTLISLARVHDDLGDPVRSLTLLAQAERALEFHPDPWLILASRTNSAWYLCQSGEAELADKALEESQHLAAQHDNPVARLRLSWRRADFARRRQEMAQAEELLVSVRAGFRGEAMRCDAALSSMALGGLYLELSRCGEAEELAAEASPVFEELGLPARAAAARTLRAQAAAG